jgi:hypothetical protein
VVDWFGFDATKLPRKEALIYFNNRSL